MNSSTLRRRVTRSASVIAAAALALGGTIAFAAPANAADARAVTDATLSWGLSGEAGGGAFFGGCNFLSAGQAGNTGSSRVWTEADGFFKNSDGDVTITKPDAAGTQQPATWATKCQNPSGIAVSAASTTNLTKIQVNIANGTGAVAADGSVDLSWDGDFTVAFYGGMTYWTASDPQLSLDANGDGQLTATASGYGTSMEDQSIWVPIADQEIVLADITGGQVSATGFTATPDYLGVTVTTASTAQTTTGANWGSFPQSFVDFQQLTGQTSYWYSSGGSRDPAKPATPLTVSYAAPVAAPAVTVSKSSKVNPAGEVLTVTGSGFAANAGANGTRPPLAGQFAGAYVVFGKFATAWQPSAGAASSARKVITQKWALLEPQFTTVGGAAAGAIPLTADGTFSTEITVSASEANNLLAGNYGIYTYGGSGAAYAPFETFTPITFLGEGEVVVEVPEQPEAPSGAFGWDFTGTSPANLGIATQSGANFVATGSLNDIVVTDTRKGGTAPYSWSVSGQAGAFTAGAQTFSGGFLGWTPKLVSGAATVGAAVTSTQTGGTGLGSSRVLGSSTTAASATLGADLALVIPGTTAAGAYTSKITITALAN